MLRSERGGLSRRGLFRVGVGAAGVVVAGVPVAKACAKATASQPLGPFFPRRDTPTDVIREDADPQTPIYLANDNDLTFIKGREGKAQGQVVHIDGTLQDAQCQPLSGATIIIWQASASGRYNHNGDGQNQNFPHPETGETIVRTLDPYFQYWGRATTGGDGNYNFKTILPGFYPASLARKWYRPPHIHFLVMATGVPQFVTQMYFRSRHFADNDFIQRLNARDSLLQNADATAREKLLVDFAPDNSRGNELSGRFEIIMPA